MTTETIQHSPRYVSWLRGLAEKGGKGVVGNIDARCLGRVADEIVDTAAERDRLRAALERGVELQSGDLIGHEWKAAINAWLVEARAALAACREGG